MKSLLVLSILLLPFFGQSQDKSYESKEKRKAFYNQLISKYGDAEIKYIFNSDNEFKFEQWLDGKKESDLIDDYPTVIHELFHGICESSNNYQYLLLDSAYVIKYECGKVFNSKELNSVFRKGQQDSIMRYGLYVAGINKLPDGSVDNRINSNRHNEVASVAFGIYGMFEEFCAYYQGANAAYKLYDYYVEKFGKKDNEGWNDYLNDVKSNLDALFEFRVFMSNYLSYARKNHKDVYEGIMKNKDFRISFTIFEQRFEKLYENFTKLEKEILKFHKTDNFEVLNQLDWSGSNEDIYKFFSLSGEDVANELFEVKNGKYIFKYDAATFKDLKKEYNNFGNQVKAMNKGNGLILFYTNRFAYERYVKTEYESVKKELEVFRVEGIDEENYKNYLRKAR